MTDGEKKAKKKKKREAMLQMLAPNLVEADPRVGNIWCLYGIIYVQYKSKTAYLAMEFELVKVEIRFYYWFPLLSQAFCNNLKTLYIHVLPTVGVGLFRLGL